MTGKTLQCSFRLVLLLLLVSLCLAGGCGPASLMERPSGWPDEFAERKLYNTPEAYIYASSDFAAGEADRLVREVTADFEAVTGRKPAKTLLIVTDTADEPIAKDAATFLKLLAENTDNKPEAEKIDAESEKLEKQFSEDGLPRDFLLRMMPVPLTPANLAEHLDLPETVTESVQWAFAIPTKAAIRQTLKSTMSQQMKGNGMGLVAQAMFAPLLIIVESTVVNAISITREAMMFQCFAREETGLDDQYIETITEEYEDRISKKAVGPLMMFAGQKEWKKYADKQEE